MRRFLFALLGFTMAAYALYQGFNHCCFSTAPPIGSYFGRYVISRSCPELA